MARGSVRIAGGGENGNRGKDGTSPRKKIELEKGKKIKKKKLPKLRERRPKVGK